MFDLLAGSATPIENVDELGLVPTAATCVLRDPLGVQVEAPAVTLPTVSTTVSATPTASALPVASVVGIQAGRRYVVTWDGVPHVVRVASIDGSTLRLRDALPSVPDVGATVRDLRMTASVAALATTRIGAGWQVEWRYNDGTTYRVQTTEAAVVRWPWRPALSGSDVSSILSSIFRTQRDLDWCQGIADRVDALLRTQIEHTGRRPELFLEASRFAEVARKGALWLLAEHGYSLNGDPLATSREYRFAFNDESQRVVASLTAYADAQGRTDPALRRNVLSIPTVR